MGFPAGAGVGSSTFTGASVESASDVGDAVGASVYFVGEGVGSET